MKEANPFLRAALAYAGQLHWPVFPLKPRAKEPLTPHGYKDATLDEEIIRQWWAKWPKANIGIPTGINFWALDIDPRNGGDDSRAQLVAKHGALADTIRQMTGGGGNQYLYEMPDQQKIGCYTAVWPGIDVKGEGGYIVVPPSIHPSGKRYEWDTAKRSILEETINPANGWLIAEIIAATNHRGAGEPFALPEKLKKGEQHKVLFKMGAAMRAKGCGYDEILAALWEVNQNRCEEPGPRANIEKLARDVTKRYPAGQKNGSKPAPPKGPRPIECSGAAAIYNSDYPEPAPIVDPILYPGLTILGGRPKVGKSWFSLQLAVALISGTKLAAYLEVKKQPCRCLYVSLEDRPRQIRSRLRRLTPEEPFLARLDFIFELDALMGGGAAQLDRRLTEHPVDVVIVDSLLAAVKQAKREHVDVMQADYNIVAILREIAEKHALALVLVAHTRKAGGDFLDLIQGTSGTTAAADAVWVLQRTPEGEATLSVTGREIATNIFGMKRVDDYPAWTISGEGDEVTQSEARRDILELLREEGPLKPGKLAQLLRKNISNVHRLLKALCDVGLVVRSQYGTYCDVATHNPSQKNGKEEQIQ
jgi:hypothetical protein